jgi:phosphonate transport system substrate-binding protein
MDVFEVLSSRRCRMSVCPHDTARSVYGWFFLNSYLQPRLGIRLGFEAQENFLVERAEVLSGGYDLVYANPYSAALFARERGFVPVARPVGVSDETYLVARPDWKPPTDGRGLRVASATDQLIVHRLGLDLLPGIGLSEDAVELVFAGSHLAAAKSVIDGQADLGFVFNETWTGMSEYSRSELRVLGRTTQGTAFHCFMVGGSCVDRLDEVRTVLTSMASDPEATEILAELGFGAGLRAVSVEEFAALSDLVPVATA